MSVVYSLNELRVKNKPLTVDTLQAISSCHKFKYVAMDRGNNFVLCTDMIIKSGHIY